MDFCNVAKSHKCKIRIKNSASTKAKYKNDTGMKKYLYSNSIYERPNLQLEKSKKFFTGTSNVWNHQKPNHVILASSCTAQGIPIEHTRPITSHIKENLNYAH